LEGPNKTSRVLPWLLLAVAIAVVAGYLIGKHLAQADSRDELRSGTMADAAAAAPAATSGLDLATLEQQLRDAETAFARSMADRDIDAFASFLAEDAAFVNGRNPLRGKAAILADWAKYFEGEQAPFAWTPETVVVLAG